MIAEPSGAGRADLLRELSERFPSFAVWKKLERTIEGQGDVDAVAPAPAWQDIGDVFGEWAFSRGYRALVGCRHVPGVLLLMAVDPSEVILSELDLCDTFYWRGGRFATATQLAPVLAEGVHGIRVARPGAQGLFLLVMNGLRRGGRVDRAALHDQGVSQLIASDREGVDRTAASLGRIGSALRPLAVAVAEGGWDRSAALRAEALGVMNAAKAPVDLVRRLSFRLRADRSCPIVIATRDGPRGRDDIERWLTTPSPFHAVVRA